MSTAKQTDPSKKRIAVLEDNLAQAQAVTHWLEKAGYAVLAAHDGDSFLELVGREKVDMLLLDWDVPGKTGIDVLKEIRGRLAFLMPIVMLTQHDDERDILHGLDSGADDFLVKPASERMLVARVVAQLRKYYPETQARRSVSFDGYTLDEAARTATLPDGETVALPEREFAIAYYLFEHAGRVVARDTLLTHVWGEAAQEQAGTLATYMTRLRNMLRLRANGLRLSSVYRYGYRLERLADADDDLID